MKRRFPALLLLALCLFQLCAVPAAAEDECPYAILVNRAANTVTVYSRDEAGDHTVPVRAMICSVGRAGHETPLGTFSVLPLKKPWCEMYDGTYAQYTTAFYGDILFHSVCYWSPHPAWLIASEYNDLGSPASLGCVRLQTVDAKWIYDNCAPGTSVTVYDDAEDPGPLGKPARLVDHVEQTTDFDCWDPTDPRDENPWRAKLAESFSLDISSVSLTAGQAASLRWTMFPESAAALLRPVWTSADPAVASVDENGRIVGMGQGSTVVTGTAGGLEVSCAVSVTGSLLPFEDAVPGAWYYDDLRYITGTGMMKGTGERLFSPELPVSCAMAVQTLYNLSLAGSGETAEAETEDTEAQIPWYAAAMAWAEETGLTEEVGSAPLTPERAVSRQELAALLWRYEGVIAGRAPESAPLPPGYADASEVDPVSLPGVGWAVKVGLLRGTGADALDPASPLTRAQLAALLHRWTALGA